MDEINTKGICEDPYIKMLFKQFEDHSKHKVIADVALAPNFTMPYWNNDFVLALLKKVKAQNNMIAEHEKGINSVLIALRGYE